MSDTLPFIVNNTSIVQTVTNRIPSGVGSKIPFNHSEMSIDLAKKIFTRIQTKRNQMPLRQKIWLNVSIRSISRGNKKEISKEYYNKIFKCEYKRMKKGFYVRWGERRILKKYIENTMDKMYIVS